jgi:hypothetical protein
MLSVPDIALEEAEAKRISGRLQAIYDGKSRILGGGPIWWLREAQFFLSSSSRRVGAGVYDDEEDGGRSLFFFSFGTTGGLYLGNKRRSTHPATALP